MKSEYTPLQLPVGVGSGTALPVSVYREKWIQSAGLVGGPPILEGSMDGSLWSSCVASVVNGLTSVPQTVAYLRVTASVAVTAGTITFGGFNSRTDV